MPAPSDAETQSPAQGVGLTKFRRAEDLTPAEASDAGESEEERIDEGRDEERQLEACLESVCAVADELVVVDTGSRDRTPEIARATTRRWISEVPSKSV